jgi:hypothetical protein
MIVQRGEGNFLRPLKAEGTSLSRSAPPTSRGFDLGHHLKRVDGILDRVFGEWGGRARRADQVGGDSGQVGWASEAANRARIRPAPG